MDGPCSILWLGSHCWSTILARSIHEPTFTYMFVGTSKARHTFLCRAVESCLPRASRHHAARWGALKSLPSSRAHSPSSMREDEWSIGVLLHYSGWSSK